DRHFAMQVIAVALEDRMLLEPELHIEVARWATVHAGFAVARRTDPHAVVDAGWNLHLLGLGELDATGAVGLFRRLGGDLAGAVAGRAGLLHGKEALLDPHHALAAAGSTGLRLGAGFRAAALAGGAVVPRRHPDFGLIAGSGLLERDLHGIAQIRPAVDVAGAAARAAGAGTGAKDVAEDVAEDVRKTAEAARAAAWARRAFDAGMAIAVVGIALSRIRQDLVRFLDFLELL